MQIPGFSMQTYVFLKYEQQFKLSVHLVRRQLFMNVFTSLHSLDFLSKDYEKSC